MESGINVCLACDDNYAVYAGVVIASILYNADVKDNLIFYILDGGIEDKHKQELLSLKSIKDCEINFVKIDESKFEDYKKVKTHDYITIATYYRLKLPSLLPDVKRVIYFDCDFVINSSLNELYNTEMGDAAVAGVRDINKRKLSKNKGYVNAGMLVFDIENMKKQNLEQKFLDWTKENINTIKLGDQEIINSVLEGQIVIVPDEWNVQSSNFVNRSSYTNTPRAIHYVAKRKPWHYGSFSYHRPLYFKYLQMTPWKLSDEDLKHWTKDNQIDSIIGYLKYRPLFFLRPRFYMALYCTYLKSIFETIFSLKDLNETHKILTILGIKIKYPKSEYLNKKKENPYYYYKNNNIDITTLPPAKGQLRDIQLANLALLDELDYVCKQNGLTYWLDGGTLLGAVRHKGYIPWDDDIDVAMLREDYEKIIDAFKKSSRNPDIYADYIKSKSKYHNCHIKVQHKKSDFLFVDIFPWDYYGKTLTTEEQIKKSEEIKQIRNTLKKKVSPFNNNNEIKRMIEKMEKEQILVIPENEKTENGDFVWGLDFNHIWKNWFTHYDTLYPIKTIEFEGKQYPCLNNPDAFLSRLYGNYMDYPPKLGVGHSMYMKLAKKEKDIINNLKNQVGKE